MRMFGTTYGKIVKFAAGFFLALSILRLVPIPAFNELAKVPDVFADTVIFNDTFTVGANTSLASRVPDTGTSWTRIRTTGGGNEIMTVLAASDNVAPGALAECTTNEGVGYVADATYSGADYYVETTMTTGDTADDYDWIGVRVESDADGYWLRFNNDAVTFAQLFEVSGGGATWTALGSAAGAQIADGSVVKLEINGSAIKVYDDGAEIISTTDGSLTAAGKAGIGMGDLSDNGTDDCSGQRLDNFKVTIIEAAAPSTDGDSGGIF